MASKTKIHSIDVLRDDAENAREIDDEALAGLGTSMHDFGDLSGIVFNEKTGELVAGHKRKQSLIAAGAKKWTRTGPDSGYIDHPETRERFAIRIVRWDRRKQRLANLVANNPEIQGRFTPAALDQLAELEEEANFAALGLDALAQCLEKELKKEAAAAEKDQKGGAPDIPTSFSVLIECTDEAQQVELLERFRDEGLKCRALN